VRDWEILLSLEPRASSVLLVSAEEEGV